MKRLSVILLLLCTAATAAAQERPWFWHPEECPLKGKVKEVRCYRPAGEDHDPELPDTSYHFYTYAPGGRILSEYWDNVDQTCHATYHWSSHLDSIVYDGECAQVQRYFYDKDGRLARVLRETPGGYASDHNPVDTNTVVYDDRGFPVGVKEEPYWYAWNDDGRVAGWGNQYFAIHYEYDSRGRLLTQRDDKGQTWTYTYNEQGDVAQIQIHGNRFNPDYTDTETFSYTYDIHGNWTERRDSHDHIIRRITYYDE